MSRLSEYSKFDNLRVDDDEEEEDNESDHPRSLSPSRPTAAGRILRDEKRPERYYYQHNDRRVYDFQQDLDQVTIYVEPPPHIQRGSQIKCQIGARHLKLGLVENDEWYLNEDTFGTVDVDESTWSLEDEEDGGGKVVCIYLTKANRGTLWDAALKGIAGASSSESTAKEEGPILNEFYKEQVKKELMLQRFQEENPGFDFRGADFNGSVPDARDFMGGVKYD
jgi:hypothetical protein